INRLLRNRNEFVAYGQQLNHPGILDRGNRLFLLPPLEQRTDNATPDAPDDRFTDVSCRNATVLLPLLALRAPDGQGETAPDRIPFHATGRLGYLGPEARVPAQQGLGTLGDLAGSAGIETHLFGIGAIELQGLVAEFRRQPLLEGDGEIADLTG